MLKRPIVSLFHSLRSKGKRYYWVPPNPDEFNKLSLIKQKYDIPKDILELMDEQEKNIKKLNEQLTNQKKVIEQIYDTVEHIDDYNHDSRVVQIMTLVYVFLISISRH